MGWGLWGGCLAPCTQHLPHWPLCLHYSHGLQLPNAPVTSDGLFFMTIPGRAGSSWEAGQREMFYPSAFVMSEYQGTRVVPAVFVRQFSTSLKNLLQSVAPKAGPALPRWPPHL